jgi:hypothetical protein
VGDDSVIVCAPDCNSLCDDVVSDRDAGLGTLADSANLPLTDDDSERGDEVGDVVDEDEGGGHEQVFFSVGDFIEWGNP